MKIISFLILFISLYTFTKAQTIPTTPYQKKIFSIKTQTLRELGISETILNKAKTLEDLNTLTEVIGSDPTTIQRIGKERLLSIILKENKLLNDAEYLKNDSERNKDRLAKIESDKKRKLDELNKSDYGILIKNIKTAYEKWLEKGEFEKTNDFEKRLSTSAKESFNTIAFQEINSAIKLKKHQFQDYLNSKINLMSYDADKEFFPISIELFGSKKWIDTIKIPLQQANAFKSGFHYYKIDIQKSDEWFLENNKWFPREIELKNYENEKILFKIPIKNETIIDLKPSEIGFNQNFLDGVRFNYQSFIIQTKEQARLLEQEKLQREIELNKQRLIIEVARKKEDSIKLEKEKEKVFLIAEQKRKEDSTIMEEKKRQALETIELERIYNDSAIQLQYEHLALKDKIYFENYSDNKNKKRRLIYEKYLVLINFYEESKKREETYTYERFNAVKNQIKIDKYILSLNDTKAINDLSNNLEKQVYPSEIEYVFITFFKN